MTVPGHAPRYQVPSDELQARSFGLTPHVWHRLSSFGVRWAENKHFRDQTLRRGDPIVLATAPWYARCGSRFALELRYLALHGRRNPRQFQLLG